MYTTVFRKLFSVWEHLPACLSVHHMCLVPAEGGRVLDPLELELQMFVSFCVDLELKPGSSGTNR